MKPKPDQPSPQPKPTPPSPSPWAQFTPLLFFSRSVRPTLWPSSRQRTRVPRPAHPRSACSLSLTAPQAHPPAPQPALPALVPHRLPPGPARQRSSLPFLPGSAQRPPGITGEVAVIPIPPQSPALPFLTPAAPPAPPSHPASAAPTLAAAAHFALQRRAPRRRGHAASPPPQPRRAPQELHRTARSFPRGCCLVLQPARAARSNPSRRRTTGRTDPCNISAGTPRIDP